MPLFKNTFQPYFPDANAPNPMACNGSYCYPVSSGDVVHQQFYQTPCSASLVCDPLFGEFTLGADLVTNGGFLANADDWFVNAVEIASTACPATVDAWCYDSVDQNIGHDGSLSLGALAYQDIPAMAINTLYQVGYTISGQSQGNIQAILGSSGGAQGGADYYESQTVLETVFFSDVDERLAFSPSTDFDGSITDITLRAVTMDCWIGDNWAFDDGVACKSAAGTGALYNGTNLYMDVDDYYVVSVEVLGYVSGSLITYIDDGAGNQTDPQTAISANGIYTFYITASQDGVIGFDPSSNFIGCLRGVTVQRLRNDFTFQLINAAGDVVDISDTATYNENKVDLNVDFAALLESGVIQDYGCYTITVTDACLVSGDNLVVDGGFSDGNDRWAGGAGAWQYDFSVPGEVTFIFEPLGDNPTLITDGNPIAAGGWTAGANWAFIGSGFQHTPGSTATLSQSITISAPAIPPAQLYIWHQIRISGRTAGSITVTISTTTSGAMSTNNTYTTLTLPKPTVGGAVTFAITPTSNFDGTIELVAVHQATRIWSGSPSIANPANTAIVAGNYELEYEITNILGNAGNQIGGSAWIRNPSFPPGFIPGIGLGVHTHQQLGYVPGSTVIEIGGDFFDATTSYPGRVTIDDYSVVRIEPFEATYTSECLNFQQSHLNTTLITGYCDRDAMGSTPIDALGFASTGYILQMRVRCRSYAASLAVQANYGDFSNGDQALKYAALEKHWVLVTDFLSESALMALGAMARCDHFFISESGEGTEYTVTVEDFNPEWRPDGDYDLAPARIEIRVKTGGMKFNRHT